MVFYSAFLRKTFLNIFILTEKCPTNLIKNLKLWSVLVHYNYHTLFQNSMNSQIKCYMIRKSIVKLNSIKLITL